MKWLMTGLFVGFASCSQVTEEQSNTCGAAELQHLVGTNASAIDIRETATVRIITPNSVVTQDFNEARLNISLDADDKVVRIWCG